MSRINALNKLIGTDERERNTANDDYWYEMQEKPKADLPMLLRRLFARFLDLYLYKVVWSVVLVLVWNVNISLRTTAWTLMDSYIAFGFMLLAEPFFLSRFGTTPGKWIMGLSVKNYDGNNLTYELAFSRTWSVFLYGLGLGIPFYDLYRIYKSKVICSNGESLYWENESAVLFRSISAGRVVGYIGCTILLTGVMLFAVYFVSLPINRGDITAEEFCENYNRLAEYYNLEERYVLMPDGTWEEKSVNGTTYVIEIIRDEKPQFLFETDTDGYLTGVSFEMIYEDESMRVPAYQEEQLLAIKAFAGAQREISLRQNELEPLLERVISEPEKDYCFTVHDIEITCDMELNNFQWVDSFGWYLALENENYFRLTFSMQK